MARVAVLMAEGYEEGETITIVDILRRAGAEVTTFCFSDDRFVKGMYGMYVQADEKFSDVVKDYDAIVLPGGRPGGANLERPATSPGEENLRAAGRGYRRNFCF